MDAFTRRIWSEQTKKRAQKLRRKGLSYGKITKDLGVPKSTLHGWIHGIKSPGVDWEKERQHHLIRIRKLAVEANKQKREARLNVIRTKIRSELENSNLSSLEHLKSILSMLYWAEGTKWRGTLSFANTDPKLMLLFVTLLRKCYKIDESKLRVRLHLHYYHPIRSTKRFWSNLLTIPEAKFGKIYIKKRSLTKRFRKNFAGICFLRYYSEDLRFELIERGQQIANKLVPVA